MYNSLIILVCVFAVYGAYTLIREVMVLLSRKSRVYVAIDVSEGNVDDKILLAEFYASKYSFFASRPIIVCEESKIEEVKKYGYKICVELPGKENHAYKE